MSAFLDSHGHAINVICLAVVLAAFAFVATALVIDRIRHPAESRAQHKRRGF